MRKITDIYEEYKIMPNLQMHQYRVAAVASQICDSLKIKVDKESIITACLIHDMGNIIKSHLDDNIFSYSDDEITYWKSVKEEFINKYNNDENKATELIAIELGVNPKIVEIFSHTFFIKIPELDKEKTWEGKIIKYSDLRVGLHSIVSLNDRLIDVEKRYKSLLDKKIEESIHHIENDIFSNSNIKPADINNESVREIIENLKNFEF